MKKEILITIFVLTLITLTGCEVQEEGPKLSADSFGSFSCTSHPVNVINVRIKIVINISFFIFSPQHLPGCFAHHQSGLK
jgi:hypothetical protein